MLFGTTSDTIFVVHRDTLKQKEFCMNAPMFCPPTTQIGPLRRREKIGEALHPLIATSWPKQGISPCRPYFQMCFDVWAHLMNLDTYTDNLMKGNVPHFNMGGGSYLCQGILQNNLPGVQASSRRSQQPDQPHPLPLSFMHSFPVSL